MKSLFLTLVKSISTYLIIAAIAFIAVKLNSMQIVYSDFTVTTPGGTTSATAFPFFASSNERGTYSLHGTATLTESSSRQVQIIPDDEIIGLAINGVAVNLEIIPIQQRRDYNKGFSYDLTPFLQTGTNQIDIYYTDGGGLMGIIMAPVQEDFYTRLLYILLTLALLFVIHLAIKNTSLSKSLQVLFLGALLVRVLYFIVTPADVRGHDLGDHMDYIKYLSVHWTPPPLEQATGGAFFHPPLYYYTGAVVHKITQWFDPINLHAYERAQQLLSLVFSMGFVFFGLLILSRLLDSYKTHHNSQRFTWFSASYWCSAYRENGLFWIVGALFAFWPVSVIHSPRVGNDAILYCFLTAGLYYLFRWYQQDNKRDLMIASICAALATTSKANGEILIAAIVLVGLYKMIRSRQWATYFKMAIAPGLVLFIGFAITVLPGLLLNLQGKREFLYFEDASGVSSANLVGNTAANLLWFDAKIFITEPFADPYDDRMGRQYFWNYLGKTGIVGEFKYDGKLATNTTIICSFLAVWMMLYIIVGFYHMRREDIKRQAPLILTGFLLWAGVTYMRVNVPVNIDFRYIVPALVSFCALYAVSIVTFRERGATRLANTGLAMAAAFTLSSIAFVFGLL
ncbi:MAG TPA: glycosyltransferase family 39 protein [Cellvibrio sp.]|nr:glycosyltransferase family 39 protein [Cellvibrio sp.]